jgi:hypothetical protein
MPMEQPDGDGKLDDNDDEQLSYGRLSNEWCNGLVMDSLMMT